MRLGILLILLVVVVLGCNTHSSTSMKESITEDTIIPQGVKRGVLNILTSQIDPNCHYGLYIPKDSCKNYPLVVIFDPHAAGNHAASQYQELADKYKIILAGSNNIQNGMTSDKYVYFTNCIIDDVMNLVPIDSDFVYLMGFSGGARVASYVAQTQNVFRGVIGCGAGIADLANVRTSGFMYVGFAGYSDFNFSEVYKSESVLRQSQIKTNFRYFEGKHEWPPDTVMEYAFAAMSLNMKKSPAEAVKEFVQKELNSNKTIPIRDSWKKMVNYKSLKDLMENYSGFDTEKNKVYGYLSGYESKTAEKTISSSFNAEVKAQTEIQKAFSDKDKDWWKKRIALLNAAYEKKDKTPSDYRDIRLLSYISMSCYMLVSSSLKNNEIEQAQKILSIYAMADPSNADVTYMYGVMHAQANNFQIAIDSLSSALKKGYSDKSKWKNERAFIPLKDSLRFIDLETRLNAIL